jgi:hypothetical protein
MGKRQSLEFIPLPLIPLPNIPLPPACPKTRQKSEKWGQKNFGFYFFASIFLPRPFTINRPNSIRFVLPLVFIQFPFYMAPRSRDCKALALLVRRIQCPAWRLFLGSNHPMPPCQNILTS